MSKLDDIIKEVEGRQVEQPVVEQKIESKKPIVNEDTVFSPEDKQREISSVLQKELLPRCL